MQLQLTTLFVLASTLVTSTLALPSAEPSIFTRDLASKSRLYPNGLGVFNSNYASKVAPVSGQISRWNRGHGPQVCRERALQARSATDSRPRCELAKLGVFDVTYTDCSRNWVMCRCDDAEMTEAQMVAEFGRLPSKLRSWVRHIIAFQGGSTCGGAGSSDDVISFYGQCANPTVFIHEAAHSIDQGFSQQQSWRDTVELDTCIPDAYAGSSYAENFAQVVVVNMSGRNAGSTGGINTQCMRNQMDAVWNRFGSQLTPGGTCDLTVRRPNSPDIVW